MQEEEWFGAVEAGGTKFNCAVGTRDGNLQTTIRVDTTTPSETLSIVQQFFDEAQARLGEPRAVGIGTFGPVDLDPRSITWGHILKTPKRGWEGADLAGSLCRNLRRPVVIDTDVNAAALGELRLGAGRNVASLAYVTVGTGIGGGAIVNGEPLRGFLHSEMGHLMVRRDPRDAEFRGTCPFHGDCLEGLASGPAIKARWGVSLDQLNHVPDARSIIAGYLGQLATSIALLLSSDRIVFGGGVMSTEGLLPLVRTYTQQALNGYLPLERVAPSFEEYIVAPQLGDRSGIIGALRLAIEAHAG